MKITQHGCVVVTLNSDGTPRIIVANFEGVGGNNDQLTVEAIKWAYSQMANLIPILQASIR